MRSLRKSEWLLLVAGLGLLAFCICAYLTGMIQSRIALRRFHNQLSHSDRQRNSSSASSGDLLNVDFSLWSEKRVRDFEASLAEKFDAPVAVLKIQKVRLEVPVFDGIDELTLNRGAGRIVGTSFPGEKGNVGIAGHRDGFFRSLKDVAVGDEVELETTEETLKYIIDSITIVDRDDLTPLETGKRPSVTLVTCYPFYFIGSAPKRYIVHASLQEVQSVMNRPAEASSPGRNR